MFSFPRQCPVCSASITDWSTRCPKCRYHPDCDRPPLGRALDDVALVARYRQANPTSAAAPGSGHHAWRKLLTTWFRRPGIA